MNVYLHYLQLTSAEHLALDAISFAIFNRVLASEDKLRVKDILALKDLASQATLHNRLTRLVATKYLKVVMDKEDNRSKFVTVGKAGDLLIKRLSKAIEQSAKKK